MFPNMDPKTAELAMEQMKNMSPEQMQAMMNSMPGGMNPQMMSQAMEQMKNMKSEDWDTAKRQMANMSPEELSRAASSAQTQNTAQQRYVLDAAVLLKNQGNTLHSAGQYSEALEKYEKAKSNVADNPHQEATALKKACHLNLSSCYLNLMKYDKCVIECDQVLAADQENLKALYRRGQAYLHSKQWQAAVSDLERAYNLSASDPVQQKMIKEKLQESKDGRSISKNDDSPPDLSSLPAGATPAPAPSATTTTTTTMALVASSSGTQSDVTPEALAAMANMNPAQIEAMTKMAAAMPKDVADKLRSCAASSGSGNPGHDPTLVAETARAMAENPEMAKFAAEMMQNMSPDELARVAQQSGLPPGMSLTPEMAQAACASLGKMSPEEIKQMTAMASARGGGAAAPTGQAAQMQAAMAVMSSGATGTAGMPALTPDMAKMASDMMKNMSPDDMARMSQMAQSMGAMPGGATSQASLMQAAMAAMSGGAPGPAGMPALTPDMAKMASDMMKNMSPDDMARMSQMAQSMGGMPGGSPGMPPLGGGAPPADMMASMTADPKFMENAMNMMRNMDEETMTSMMKQSGLVKTDDQARQMAKQMKGMSDGQVKMMMKAANVVQAGSRGFAKVRDAVTSRSFLLISLLVLLLALLLRYLGVM